MYIYNSIITIINLNKLKFYYTNLYIYFFILIRETPNIYIVFFQFYFFSNMNNNNNKQLVNVNEMQEKNVTFDSITQAGIKYFFNDTACSGCRNKLINSLFIQEFSFMDTNNQELQTKANFNNYIQTEFRKLAEDLFDFITIYGK